ncbi:MAG TPA: hypothetical protein VFV50_01705 [Bdellovibrionales bacterium]|nr:hypothetical protein [Bdellovibrionales bacterium]
MIKLLALFVLIATTNAHADTLFEGWYRVLSAGQHVGYVVQRYEVDPKTRIFTSTYFLKTNAFGNEVTEAVRAKAAENLTPISYQYTSKVGKKTKVIDAVFEGGTPAKKPTKTKAKIDKTPEGLRIVATVSEEGKVQKIDKVLPKGAFLSTFLVYLMLQNKEGIKVGNNYEYQAIAEEDGEAYNGKAFIKETTKQNGVEVFKILNTFKNIQFINHVTAKGEVTYTKTPVLHLVSELATSADDARKSIPLEEKSIRTLFGTVPGAGTLASSPLAQGGEPAAPEPAKPVDAKPEEPVKGAGVAPGQGIITKPGSKGQESATTTE